MSTVAKIAAQSARSGAAEKTDVVRPLTPWVASFINRPSTEPEENAMSETRHRDDDGNKTREATKATAGAE